jgi:hypothetical protein
MIPFPAFRLTLALAAGAAMVPAAAAAQQPLPPPPKAVSPSVSSTGNPQDPAYADLYAAMESSVDQGQIMEGVVSALAGQFAATPEFAMAEEASPGLIEEVVAGLRPVFMAQSERVRLLYRPANIALFARTFTPQEAVTIAAFYRSDLGRKLMGGLSRSYVPQDTLSTALDGSAITRDQVDADLGRAINAAMGTMTEQDMIEMGRLALANPALLKLERLGGAVKEIRVQMENEPLTADETAAVEAVIEDVFARRFPEE